MMRSAAGALLAVVTAGCVATGDDLGGLAEQPPLDCAVLVTGGAYLQPAAAGDGTFGGLAAVGGEAIPITAIADVLERGTVFQRVAIDHDAGRRRDLRDRLLGRGTDDGTAAMLQQARADGFDLLLMVEELQDGPIESRGTNGRWPVTFATWILLGVGALIPDRSFESRAALRVTLRDLQAGRVLHDALLVAGPVDLALSERTDNWGLLQSILVPPFWVADDLAAVTNAVRATTERRLLLSLARDLKSESVRQRLRERAAATVTLLPAPAGDVVVVDAGESLTVVRLRGDPAVHAAVAARFEQQLLASVAVAGGRYRYEAPLPDTLRAGRVQVLVGTLRGEVASATFAPGARR